MFEYQKKRCYFCKKSKVPLNKGVVSRRKSGEIIIYWRCRKCNTKIARKYRSTEQGRERLRVATKKYREKSILQVRARWKVAKALKSCKLKKQMCFCGNSRTEAHHSNYSKPLDVVWLCKEHHANLHKRKSARKD